MTALLPLARDLATRLEAMVLIEMERFPESWSEPDRREMAERSLGFASPILNEESDRG